MCGELPTDEARGRVVSAIVEGLQTGQTPKVADIAERLIAANLVLDAEINARKWASKSHPGKAGAPKGNPNAKKKPGNNRETIEEQSENNRETIGAGEEENEESEGKTKENKTEEEEQSSDSGPSVFISSSIGSSDFGAWAARQTDPVAVAVAATGEGDRARRVYGALLKGVDKRDFIDECVTFVAELDAGEKVRNKGAALVARLKKLATADTPSKRVNDPVLRKSPAVSGIVNRMAEKMCAKPETKPNTSHEETIEDFLARGAPGWTPEKRQKVAAWVAESDIRKTYDVPSVEYQTDHL